VKPAPLLVYTVLRLLAFLVPLAILWFFFPIFREFWWLAAVFAALIGTSISMLFLRRPLSEASAELHQRRQGRETAGEADAAAEDAVIDRPDADDAGPARG
jgi:uncharacterized protein involved in exopolysaccharide biosynthesis